MDTKGIPTLQRMMRRRNHLYKWKKKMKMNVYFLQSYSRTCLVEVLLNDSILDMNLRLDQCSSSLFSLEGLQNLRLELLPSELDLCKTDRPLILVRYNLNTNFRTLTSDETQKRTKNTGNGRQNWRA